MKYAVYLQNHHDLYVVDVPPNDEEALLQALYAMDAPIFVQSLESYLYECRMYGEDVDEDENEYSDQQLIEFAEEDGFMLVNDYFADMGSFIAQPMPPNLEVGYYATEDEMRYGRYQGMGR